jgi:uncharacterized protein (DUF1499 family)
MKRFKKIFNPFICIVVLLLLSIRAIGGDIIDTMVFEPCPASPNCVSSQSKSAKHYVEPLEYVGQRAAARQKLMDWLQHQQRVRITETGEDYLVVEFRSLVFRFVDDAAFFFPPDQQLIHVRSASRTGYYDFGVNRKRVERIRKLFH